MRKRASTEEGPARGSRKKSLLIGAGAAVACLVIGLIWLLKPAGPQHRAVTTAAAASVASLTYVETPEMVTNLDAGPHRVAFAKLQFRVALSRSADAALLTSSMPRIVDAAEGYLRVVRPEELRSGTGTYLLREALLARVATIAAPATIDSILFEELIIQ